MYSNVYRLKCMCRQIWEQGARAGDPGSMLALGELYLTGDDDAVPRNATAALERLNGAFDARHWKAPLLLAELHKEHSDVPGVPQLH